jgi:hypothetical protein
MKSNVYWRGLPPQSVQATIADAGITANKTIASAARRRPPAGTSRRTYASAPKNVRPIASGFQSSRYDSGIEMPLTLCTSPESRKPGCRNGRSPGARS